jgi:hypothetical protein
MTDDPIKLYVVVMSILLCVLGFVAYASYSQAAAYERALELAPVHAEQLRELAADVQMLCDQLKQSKLAKGYKTLIESAANYNSVSTSSISEESKAKRIGTKGKERRFRAEFRRGGQSRPLTREQVAKLCRTVELDSRNILKTIEITLRRHSGAGGIPPGREDEVMADTYTGNVIFGLRVVK